jgi:hypothetical protein
MFLLLTFIEPTGTHMVSVKNDVITNIIGTDSSSNFEGTAVAVARCTPAHAQGIDIAKRQFEDAMGEGLACAMS